MKITTTVGTPSVRMNTYVRNIEHPEKLTGFPRNTTILLCTGFLLFHIDPQVVDKRMIDRKMDYSMTISHWGSGHHSRHTFHPGSSSDIVVRLYRRGQNAEVNKREWHFCNSVSLCTTGSPDRNIDLIDRMEIRRTYLENKISDNTGSFRCLEKGIDIYPRE